MGVESCTIRCVLACLADYDYLLFFREGDEEPHLARFKGRPGEMSPKARFWMLAGCFLLDSSKFFPAIYLLNADIGIVALSLRLIAMIG